MCASSPNPAPRKSGFSSRMFALLLGPLMAPYEARIATRKAALFAGVGGQVLEIGPGLGANFAFLPAGTRWIGIEPNPYMHERLRQNAAAAGITANVQEGSADALPVEDGSVDCVISTLVLCSVPDVAATLGEIARVLKPGGTFYFIEHVAAPRGTLLRRVQDAIRPVWQAVGDGCHPNRETAAAIEAAFPGAEIERFRLRLPVVGPHIAGRARKADERSGERA